MILAKITPNKLIGRTITKDIPRRIYSRIVEIKYFMD
jgi:hypothetical protein